jgi:hypothetical protein
MAKLTEKQKEIIYNSVVNLVDSLLESFYEEFSFEQLFEDMGFKKEPDKKTMEIIEDEVDRVYNSLFKK